MPWCPKCRNEYRKGITVCAECKVELVENLDENEKQAFIFGEKEKMERLQSFLAYNGIETGLAYEEADGTYQLSAAQKQLQQAVKAARIFLHEEEERMADTQEADREAADAEDGETAALERTDVTKIEENVSETDRTDEEASYSEETPSEKGKESDETASDTAKRQGYHAYRDSAAQAEDNKSSAYTLLFVGGVGFVVVLLIFLGVIPVYQNAGTTKYLVCGVMGAMFVLFIVFGFVSMRSSKVLYGKAKTENSLTTEITKWCKENLSAEKVDEGLFEGEELAEEQKYFKRAERMRRLISDKFLNLDEAFLDHFVDEYYQTLFEDV